MKRREFIRLLGGTTTVWPIAVRAQQSAMPVIGFLSPGSLEADTSRMNAVRQGLAEIGYVEGQNAAIEYRGAQYQHDRLSELAADLVNRRVDAIIVVSASGALAAKAATNTRSYSPSVLTRCSLAWLRASIDQAAISQAYTS